MALDKLVDSAQLDANLTSVANAIRTKGGTSAPLTFPAGFVSAVEAIETGGGGGVEPQFYTWDQRPPLVAAFLDEVTYSPSDYTTSRIAQYAPATDNVNNYKPVGMAVETSAGTLNRNGYEITANAGSTTVYSDIPGRDTPFTVRNSNEITQAGILRPTGALRFINTPQAWNCRDLGGWACDGGTVKYGMLFRGGKIANADLDVLLNQLHLRYELDLRGTTEAATAPSPLIGKIGYSVFDSCAWYTLANKSLWRQMLRVVFDCAAKNEPLYFHCTAGADRTGTLACFIEALLGMPQSDIDKDYELTCFYSGTADDNRARRRNEADWTGLIGEINAVTGSTFRDKAVNFAASLGFTAAEINAFRAAMIDGTPETVTPSVRTFTIAKTLTQAALSNAATTATEYQPYETDVTPNSGYVIADVSITMGGTDITNEVWSGDETAQYRRISNALTNCTTNNDAQYVEDGGSYIATITPDEGYTLDGATVTITMGGIDVSQYYSGGTIAIPQVTGDIAISITAVEAVVPIVNLIDTIGIAADTRISASDGGNRTGAIGYAAIGAEKTADKLLRIDVGDVIRIKGVTVPAAQDTMCAMALFNADASGDPTTTVYLHQGLSHFNNLNFTYGDIFTITSERTIPAYIRISVKCTDTSAVIITRNQEIE